eukprot:4247679-Prymnesium_polylepis.2
MDVLTGAAAEQRAREDRWDVGCIKDVHEHVGEAPNVKVDHCARPALPRVGCMLARRDNALRIERSLQLRLEPPELMPQNACAPCVRRSPLFDAQLGDAIVNFLEGKLASIACVSLGMGHSSTDFQTAGVVKLRVTQLAARRAVHDAAAHLRVAG